MRKEPKPKMKSFMKILLTRNFVFTLPLVTVLLSVLFMSLSLSGVLSHGIWSQVPLLAAEPSYLAQKINLQEADAWQLFERAKDKVAQAKRPDTTLERQIVLYEESLSILDRLRRRYPSTDFAYKLSQGEEVGGIVMWRLRLEIEVLQAFKRIKDKVNVARRNPNLEEHLDSHKTSLLELNALLKDDEYSSTDLVEKLKRGESVADINILELEQEIEIITTDIINLAARLKFSEGRAKIIAALKEDVSLETKLELYKEGLDIFKELREYYPTSDVAIKLKNRECVASICLRTIGRTLQVWLVEKVEQEFEIVREKVRTVVDIDPWADRRDLEKKQNVLEDVLKLLSEIMEKYPSTKLAQDLRAGKKIRGIRVSELEAELSNITLTLERKSNSSE